MTDGYEATMRLREERPDLLPLLRLIFEMGDDGFTEGLDELVRRGLIEERQRRGRDIPFWRPVPAS